MCGICGIANLNTKEPVDENSLSLMSQAIMHRGRDDSGLHIDKYIGLASRRLSIIDVDQGKQPMCNEDGAIWVVYNGEIYNHDELRSELKRAGHVFKTLCDTEVILHGYEEYGVDVIQRLDGMFAFALWDSIKNILFIARDRMGIKPLYYAVVNDNFVFASEIKALLKHKDIKKEIKMESVIEYILCTCLLNNNSMFKGVYSLPPGAYIIYCRGKTEVIRYWDIVLSDKTYGNENDIIAELNSILGEAVRKQKMSDVDIGSLLSGGLDSGIITKLLSDKSGSDIFTFSMDYKKNKNVNPNNSDEYFSGFLAERLKTKHYSFIFDACDYYDFFEETTKSIEKPLDLTSISLFLLYMKIHEKVKVVLTGEGGDELFAGYFFFLNGIKNASTFLGFPWSPYYTVVKDLFRDDLEENDKCQHNIRREYLSLVEKHDTSDQLNVILYLFLKLYLVEMLERQDKASMAWGVEARVPFLDHKLVEYVANIPSRLKLNGDNEKYILKQAAKKILPCKILERKKRPLPFPIDPMTLYNQNKHSISLLKSTDSLVTHVFDREKTIDFLSDSGIYGNVDRLAKYRTSFAINSLDVWLRVFA